MKDVFDDALLIFVQSTFLVMFFFKIIDIFKLKSSKNLIFLIQNILKSIFYL